MNTLMNAEKIIRNSYLGNDADAVLAYNLFSFHFKAVDAIEKTSHCKAINFLYQLQNSKYTKQRIADEIFTSVKSLLLDRRRYADYFNYYYELIKKNQFTAESAIAFLC